MGIGDWGLGPILKCLVSRLYCFSVCDSNQIYILTSHYRFSSEKTESIKIFDLKGNKIKEVDGANEHTVFIDIFYDNN